MEKEKEKLELKGNNTDLHLRRFDSLFGTDTRGRIHAMPLFRTYFERFKNELYSDSEETKQIKEELEKIQIKLEQSFTKEQKNLFKQYEELNRVASKELEKQLFLFGCISSMEMMRELEETKVSAYEK